MTVRWNDTFDKDPTENGFRSGGRVKWQNAAVTLGPGGFLSRRVSVGPSARVSFELRFPEHGDHRTEAQIQLSSGSKILITLARSNDKAQISVELKSDHFTNLIRQRDYAVGATPTDGVWSLIWNHGLLQVQGPDDRVHPAYFGTSVGAAGQSTSEALRTGISGLLWRQASSEVNLNAIRFAAVPMSELTPAAKNAIRAAERYTHNRAITNPDEAPSLLADLEKELNGDNTIVIADFLDRARFSDLRLQGAEAFRAATNRQLEIYGEVLGEDHPHFQSLLLRRAMEENSGIVLGPDELVAQTKSWVESSFTSDTRHCPLNRSQHSSNCCEL